MARPRRKYVPMEAQRDAALMQLGLDPATAELHHSPALALRAFDEETGLYDPDERDPRYMLWLADEKHHVVTFGTKATVADGDLHKIAKAKRLAKEQEEFRRRVLTREPGQPRERKGKIRGRGFKRQERRA